jgi:Spy/CpxP family protein refolding chaperone
MRGGGIGRSFWLRAIFSRLDTTPGQEKEIRSAIEEFRAAARESKDSLAASRSSVAQAVKGEVFDEIAIGDATVKADAATGKVKSALEAALRRIHAVLDPKQRARLAELLEQGPSAFRRGGGPYRDGTHEI